MNQIFSGRRLCMIQDIIVPNLQKKSEEIFRAVYEKNWELIK